jgi:hypothetical protein
MPYKKPQQNTKKYFPLFNGIKEGYPENTVDTGYYKDFINIPMPNEKEIGNYNWNKKKKTTGFPAIIEFIKEHVKIEELLLLGLIFLLFDESIEDDFLLIILVYILLF